MAAAKRRRPFTPSQVEELDRLTELYIKQAKRCAKAKAYVAGCVMLASSLECSLLRFCDLYYKEALNTPHAQRRKLANRHLLKWDFADLLAVAREATWTPSNLPPHVKFDYQKRYLKRARIGDYLRRVHKLRNLVHPARYLKDHRGQHITKIYFDTASDLCQIARDWLVYQVHVSLASPRSKGKAPAT
jgi:hypothetical protein